MTTHRRYRRHAPDDAELDAELEAHPGGARELVRMITCVGGVLALAGIFLVYIGRAASESASAVQAIQVYAEGHFCAVTVIGLMVAVYVGTRAGE